MSHLNIGAFFHCLLISTVKFNVVLAMRLWAFLTTCLGFTSSFVNHPPLWTLNHIVRSTVITEERGKKRTTSIGFDLVSHHRHYRDFCSGAGNSESERTARFRLYARKSSRNGNSRLKRPKGGSGTPSEQIREGVLEVNSKN